MDENAEQIPRQVYFVAPSGGGMWLDSIYSTLWAAIAILNAGPGTRFELQKYRLDLSAAIQSADVVLILVRANQIAVQAARLAHEAGKPTVLMVHDVNETQSSLFAVNTMVVPVSSAGMGREDATSVSNLAQILRLAFEPHVLADARNAIMVKNPDMLRAGELAMISRIQAAEQGEPTIRSQSRDATSPPGAEQPRAWVDEVVFSDGTTLHFDRDDVTLIVGPNNAGKSAALKGIKSKIINAAATNPVVAHIGLAREGGPEAVVPWLRSFAKKNDSAPHDPSYQFLGATVSESHAHAFWAGRSHLGGLGDFMADLLTTEGRLSGGERASISQMWDDAPRHPLHLLYLDDELERTVSDQFRAVFGQDLVLHRLAGGSLPLLVGQRPEPGPGEDRLSRSYVAKLGQLRKLEEQGDGMRSFVSLLLHSLPFHRSILLVDEPEAFLHPPQAKAISRILATPSRGGQQVFAATHSGDVVRGMLGSAHRQVRIVRVARSGDTNHITELDPTRVAELWGDPLLRSSNILDGLFHDLVIVCEGDADARFYSAVSDALLDARAGSKRPHVMFTHVGGKDRVPLVIRALAAVGVPTRAAVDLDVISKEDTLRKIVEASGGNWDDFARDWRIVKSGIESVRPSVSVSHAKAGIATVLAGVTGEVFPADSAEKIRELLRSASPWSMAKRMGRVAVPSGDASKAYERLVTTLRTTGVFVVEDGELENFARTIGKHGPAWVNEVLARDLLQDPELASARAFVDALAHGELVRA